ncbi:MAG: aspartate carbamoyltransferase regulatory subunit [Candidatus Aenigmatarchaeota archaeon]
MKDIRVTPIRNGTVIDHLPAGSALYVLRILGYYRNDNPMSKTTSVLMHAPSRKTVWKDLVKVEDLELVEKERQKIALVAWTYRPRQMPTVNIIRNYTVAEKTILEVAERYGGLVCCQNGLEEGGKSGCISNNERWMEGTNLELRNDRFFCYYCGREQEPERLRENLIRSPAAGRKVC